MKVFSLFPLFEDLVGRLETDRIRKAEQKKKTEKQDVPLASLHQHFTKICKANKDEGETGSQGKQKRGGDGGEHTERERTVKRKRKRRRN